MTINNSKVKAFIEYISLNEKQENKVIKTKKLLVGNKAGMICYCYFTHLMLIDLKKKNDQTSALNTEKILVTLREIIEKFRIKVMECSAAENFNINNVYNTLNYYRP